LEKIDPNAQEFKDQVVSINRVTKVVKGGKNLSFSALVVVGDQNGHVGYGMGKAKEVPAAIAKGVEEAKKNFFKVPRIALTATEFEILRHLASRPGRVYSRRELLELIRDYEALDQDEKTINVHVSHLREKLEDDPSSPKFVLTVRGAGYAFAER